MNRWLLLSIAVIIVDQASKYAAEAMLSPGAPVPVIAGFFDLRLAYNRGAAFSFLGDAGGWQRWFFIALALGVSVWLLIWLTRLPRSDHLTAAALACVLGGALGNVCDRIVPSRTMVVDFLDFHLRGWHWPAFNVADIAIFVGAMLLIYLSLLDLKSGEQADGG